MDLELGAVDRGLLSRRDVSVQARYQTNLDSFPDEYSGAERWPLSASTASEQPSTNRDVKRHATPSAFHRFVVEDDQAAGARPAVDKSHGHVWTPVTEESL